LNGKKAKAMRRRALLETAGKKPLSDYIDARADKNQQTTLLTSGTRDLYQQMKRGKRSSRYDTDKAN